MKLFTLKIYSQHGLFYSGRVYKLNLKSSEGYMTVLSQHVPIMLVAEMGQFYYETEENKTNKCFSTGGIVYISQNITYFISSTIYLYKNLTLTRAKAIKERIEKEYSENKSNNLSKKLSSDLLKATKLIQKKSHGNIDDFN